MTLQYSQTDNLPLKIKKKLDQLEIDKKTFNEFITFIKSYLIKLHGNDLYRFEAFIEEHKTELDKFYEALKS